MLIAEDLLLLLTADDTGRLCAGSSNMKMALGGALLAELALMQRVDLAGPGEREQERRLIVRDAGPTGDSILDEALATVGSKEGKKPQNVVAVLGKRTRGRLDERLAAAGFLRAEEGRILGIIPTRRWPAEDTVHEASVRAGLITALRDGVATDARARTLISLLLALRAVHKAVVPDSVGLSKRELKASAKRIAEADWVGKAVRSAIDTRTASSLRVHRATSVEAAGPDITTQATSPRGSLPDLVRTRGLRAHQLFGVRRWAAWPERRPLTRSPSGPGTSRTASCPRCRWQTSPTPTWTDSQSRRT